MTAEHQNSCDCSHWVRILRRLFRFTDSSICQADTSSSRGLSISSVFAVPETNRYFISKVYLQAEERGKGFASQAIAFYERLCHERGLEAMYLTVNKHNDLGIRAYLGKGFETIDAVETDIGNGFVMDDFIMEKRVE